MIRIYIMPLIGDGSRENPRRPKYRDLADGFGSIRYGEEGIVLCAFRLTQESHDIIKVDPDVMALPEDIDTTMSQNAVDIAQAFLEDNYIPGNWISTNNTFRQVLRVTAGCFLYTQRYVRLAGVEKIFLTGIDLSTIISSIAADKRNIMMQAADSLNINYSTVTGTWTLRQMLKHFADQWSNDPILLSVITI